MKTKVLYLLTILTLLIPATGVTAAPVPVVSTAPDIQESESQGYVLQLAMPEVNVTHETRPADIPGIYQGALARQWTQVEGVLKALQERGLVETYTLLPEANAFRITALPAAEAQLEGLGALADPGLMVQSNPEAQFQARLNAEIQTAQAQAAPMEQPEAPPAPEEPTPDVQGPMLQSTEEDVEANTFLVKIQIPDNPRAAEEQQHDMDAYLDWLVREGEVTEYEWLPQAYAFRVTAEGELDKLHERPEVVEIAAYNEAALQDARATFDAAQAAWTESKAAPMGSVGLQAYTPTTPTVEVELYDNYVYAESYTDTTTVFTLTTSTGTVKDVKTLCPDGDYSCDDDWDGSPGNYDEHIYFDWFTIMEPGDILYVAQEGEIPYNITLPELTANADPDTDTVTGQAPPNIASTDPVTPPVLYVSVNGSQYVTTTNAGVYVADSVGDFDPGDSGTIRYHNANSNEIYRNFGVPVIYVRGYSNGYSRDNRVSGYVAESNAPVTVTLKRGGSSVTTDNTTSDSNGYFSVYLSQDIQGGDTVEVACGGTTEVVDVPNFDDLTSDPDTDTVTGNTDADVITDTYGMTQTLALWPTSRYDSDYGKYLLLDATGDFTATNPFYNDANPSWGSTNLDWGRGATGHLRYVNAEGNRVYEDFSAPPADPVLYVRGYDDYDRYYAPDRVGGYVTGFCDYGDVTLFDSEGNVKARAIDTWACDDIRVDFNVIIEPGDVVSATFAGLTTQVTVPSLEAEADADTDTVTGNTDADVITDTYGMTKTLTVWPETLNDGTGYVYESVIPDGAGDFSAVFTDTIDPGDHGHLRYIDADENRIYERFRAPNFYVRGDSGSYQGDNYVRAEINPNTEITVKLYRGSQMLATANGTSDNNGVYDTDLQDIYGNAAYIQTGDTVEFTFEGETVTVDVPTLDATADAPADEVSGTGPSDVVTTTADLPHTLLVNIGGIYKYTTTGSDGSFVVTGTVNPGNNGWLRYINTDGYYVYNDVRAPIVYVRGYSSGYFSDNRVSGYVAQGNVLVTLNLKRGGSTIATAYDQSGTNGYFNGDFYDVYGNAVNIEGDDTVEITASGDTISVDVPTFDVTSNADTDTVSGTTDATVVTDTYGMTQTLSLWPDTLDDNTWDAHDSVIPDGAGDFSAVFTGTIDPGDHGHLRYITDVGHRVYDDFQAEEEITEPVVYVRGYYNEWWWGSDYYQSDNYVSGYVSGFCDYGTVTLKDSGGTVRAQSSSVWACNRFSTSLTDKYGNAVDVEPGDTVEAAFGGATTVVEVPDFTVTSDADTDTVSGNTDADVITDTYGMTQTLTLWPDTFSDDTGDDYDSVIPDGTTGDFSAVFTGTIQPGDVGHLRYIDANANRVYDDFQAEEEYTKPRVYIRGGSDRYRSDTYLHIYNPDCGNVDIVLKDSGGTVKTEATVHACPWNFTYLSEEIEPGDTVEATSGDQTTVVNVPTFDVTSDPEDDAIYGTTDAAVVTDTHGMTQTLAVWPNSTYDWDYGKYVLPDANDAFTATNPFYDEAYQTWDPANLDWDPGDEGHLRYVDANDNRVYDNFFAPREDPEIHVYKDSNYVWGYVVTDEETTVTVTLKSGDTVKATAYATSDGAGWFNVNFYDNAGNPVIIEEGDDVVVETADMAVVTVPVVPLSGQADVNADTVSGEGPGDAQLLVDVGDTQTVMTDGAGNYSADFKGIDDIEPGDQVMVQHRNDDGHTVYISFYAGPKLVSQLNSYYAWGYSVAANAPVTVTLKDSDGTVKGSDTDISNNNNYFSAYLYDATGQRAMIEAGDVLEANFGNGEVVSMTVAGMTAEVNADADTLSGTGPANDALGVSVDSFNATINTDGSGNWNADPGAEGENITSGEQVTVKHINTDYHETWLYAIAPVVYVRGRDSGATAYQAENYVSGYASRRATVNVTLKDSGGATVATRRLVANAGNGYYSTSFYDALGMAADIQSGDQVIVSASPEETVDVPTIDAEVDANTDTITGTTSLVGKDLGIYVHGGQTVQTDSSGGFVATFDTIDPGDYAYIRYQNDDGHWIHTRFQAERETGDTLIRARWNGNMCNHCASGYASMANTIATVTLKRGGSTLATETDMTATNRWFSVAFTDAAGKAVPIKNGDVIEVTAGGDTTSMTVADLTAEANAESDTLYGTGPANENLEIRGDCGGSTTIDPIGNWIFNCGLGNADEGYIYYTHSEGHQTYLGWAVPYVYVREHGNYVGGYVRRGVPVTVTLQSSGGAERAVATTTSRSSNGWFWVDFDDAAGDPLIINPNDTVVVEASPAIEVPVTPLSAEADTVNDQVTGTGPANEDLGVTVGGCWRNVTTDADGNFTADASGECDLQVGDWIDVNYWNDEGNQVFIGFNAPLVRVNTVNDIVDGYATPNAAVTLTLKRGGSSIATATASTDMNGWFSAFFTDANGNLVDIKPGDTVEVTASPTNSVTLADLSATVNQTNDTVTGNGPDNAKLLVKIFSQGNGWSISKSILTDSNGNFTVDLSSEMDLTDSSYAYVRYSDANGHQTSIHTTPAQSPLLDEVERDVENAGAMVKTSTFDAANANDLTPPLTYQGGGGGKTVFASEGGSLVITKPDGSVVEPDTPFTINNTPTGEWKVQVRLWGEEGSQYAVAIGRAAHVIYLPLVVRNAGQ
jgi:hypothetical protein